MKPSAADQKDLFLESRRYQRCEFDFEKGEDCLGCNREPGVAARQYYVRTNWECEEGEYYCRRCAYDRATARDYDLRGSFRRARPMHGAAWAYLHGMKNWEAIFWGAYL